MATIAVIHAVFAWTNIKEECLFLEEGSTCVGEVHKD